MAQSSADDGSVSATSLTHLPQPYMINGRFVIPWPGFRPPGASGVLKFLATSKDESHIPPPEVLVAYTCKHFLAS